MSLIVINITKKIRKSTIMIEHLTQSLISSQPSGNGWLDD